MNRINVPKFVVICIAIMIVVPITLFAAYIASSSSGPSIAFVALMYGAAKLIRAYKPRVKHTVRSTKRHVQITFER